MEVNAAITRPGEWAALFIVAAHTRDGRQNAAPTGGVVHGTVGAAFCRPSLVYDDETLFRISNIELMDKKIYNHL
jgi:hypothetical protein